jgi:bifunctional DNA-binding transcriptional regulator/antitoxin component of YhaV-PrlF toxin-antitoxin module
MKPVPAKITSKHQFTIPKTVWKAAGLSNGQIVDVTNQGSGFFVQPRKRLKILDLIGSLKHLDDGRPTEEIILEAQRRAAYEIATGRPWTPRTDAHRRPRHQRSA